MTDEYGQIRPERDDYLEDIAELQEYIRDGRPVYFEHAENMTGHKLLIVPGRSVAFLFVPWGTKKYTASSVAFFYEGHRGPLFAHLDGTDWVHWSYAAEKFGLEQYPGDAVSLANLINRILGWGDDKMQTREESLAR